MILVVASLAVLQQAQAQGSAPKTIRSERFELVDSKGRTTFEVTAAEGAPRLALLGKDGKARIVLMLDADDSPGIFLKDGTGRHQLSMDVPQGTGPAIALRDMDRDSGITFGTDPTGVSALGFMGAHARSQIELGIAPDGSVAFRLYDRDGKVIFTASDPAKTAP